MNLDAYLATARAMVEPLMADTVIIDRWDGTTTRNPATGEETKNYGDPIYGPDVTVDDWRNGRAQILQDVSVAQEEEGGGRTVTTLRRQLRLPITATGLQVDDRVRLFDAAHDPDLIGREFRISSLHGKTFASSRRVSIEEVTS